MILVIGMMGFDWVLVVGWVGGDGGGGGLVGRGRFETCPYGLVDGVSSWVSSRR